MSLSQDNASFAGVVLTKSIARLPPSNLGCKAGEVKGRPSDLEQTTKERREP
jgi:hypothetical protein